MGLPTRWHVINSARLHHVVCSISCLYYGRAAGNSTWSGDDAAGRYSYANGQGDNYAIQWWPPAAVDVNQEPGPGPLVGLVFAHESERSQWSLSEEERDPIAHLDGLPKRLASRSRQLASTMDRLATAGFWATGWRETEWSDPLGVSTMFADGLEMFRGYLLPDEGAMFSSSFPNWTEAQSLEPNDESDPSSPARIAMRLARETRGGESVSISRVDGRKLLQHPDGETIDPHDLAMAVSMLAEIQISWSP